MEKNSLTPEESFDIINKAISNFKINYRENARVFLLWGWILTFASISNFVILKILSNWEANSLKAGNWELKGLFILGNWVVFCLIGFIILYFMVRKMKKEKRVFSHLDKFIDYLWWVAAASFVFATIISFRMKIEPPMLMLLIAGIATTTTGLVIKFRPLIIGGMSFFVFSIAATFVTNEYLALLVGAALICGYLIPGYFLRSVKE